MLKVNHLSGFGKKRPVIGGGGYDSDAQAFFTATGITDNTIKDAVDDLVVALKAASVWTKCQAIYPFVGGTADTHKYNLKDPQNTDAAFRIAWSGTVTHDANGITGNGTTGYGDTFYNNNTHGTLNSVHLSLYSRTNNANTGHDMNCRIGSPFTGLGLQLNNGGFVSFCQDNSLSAATATGSDERGFFGISRTASGGYRHQMRGAGNDKTSTSVAKVNLKMYICAQNFTGTAGAFCDRNYAFCSIGTGLSNTELADLNTAVDAFQLALSRNV
jgi:hypothetical protein